MPSREDKWRQLTAHWAASMRAFSKDYPFSNFVPGVGDVMAPVVIVGEAPGEEENAKKEPFIGPSGKLLDTWLDFIGWSRDEVWITNLVKFRPTNNADPEITSIPGWLTMTRWEIATINPKMVVTLGRFASMLYWPQPSMQAIAGKLHTKQDMPVLPMYHPSYVLRKGKAEQAMARKQFQVVKEVLDG